MTNSFTSGVFAQSAIKRFNFRSVDAETFKSQSNQNAPEVPPAPTFSEAELKAEYAKGFDEGKKIGVQETENINRALEERMNETIKYLAATVAEFEQSLATGLAGYKQQVASLAITVAKKIAGSALDTNAQEKILAAVQQSFPLLVHQPNVLITVNPSMLEGLQQKISGLVAEKGLKTVFNFHANPEVMLADCKLEWKSGGIESTRAEEWKQIEKLLEEIAK